jgi:acetolactate synthase small subunit
LKIKFIEEEIDIRVESIKYELEQEGEKLKNKLRNMKKEIITYE